MGPARDKGEILILIFAAPLGATDSENTASGPETNFADRVLSTEDRMIIKEEYFNDLYVFTIFENGKGG